MEQIELSSLSNTHAHMRKYVDVLEHGAVLFLWLIFPFSLILFLLLFVRLLTVIAYDFSAVLCEDVKMRQLRHTEESFLKLFKIFLKFCQLAPLEIRVTNRI